MQFSGVGRERQEEGAEEVKVQHTEVQLTDERFAHSEVPTNAPGDGDDAKIQVTQDGGLAGKHAGQGKKGKSGKQKRKSKKLSAAETQALQASQGPQGPQGPQVGVPQGLPQPEPQPQLQPQPQPQPQIQRQQQAPVRHAPESSPPDDHLSMEDATRAAGWQDLNPDANIYVSNLPPDSTEGQLRRMFSVYGPIARLRVTPPSGTQRHAWALIQFERIEDSNRALSALRAFKFPDGRTMKLSVALRRRSSLSDEPTNLYVRGLPHHWAEGEVVKAFRRFGNIVQVKATAGDGIAFVRFDTHHEAINAIDAMHRQIVEGCTIEVKFANRKDAAMKYKSEDQGSHTDNKHNLYVKNLPRGMRQADLESVFSQFGKISSARLNDTGVAFVRFVSATDAQHAITTLNGKTMEGSIDPLIVKLAYFDIGDKRNRQHWKHVTSHRRQQGFYPKGQFVPHFGATPNTPPRQERVVDARVAAVSNANLVNFQQSPQQTLQQSQQPTLQQVQQSLVQLQLQHQQLALAQAQAQVQAAQSAQAAQNAQGSQANQPSVAQSYLSQLSFLGNPGLLPSAYGINSAVNQPSVPLWQHSVPLSTSSMHSIPQVNQQLLLPQGNPSLAMMGNPLSAASALTQTSSIPTPASHNAYQVLQQATKSEPPRPPQAQQQWTPEQQRQGNQLYKVVSARYPSNAGKITGMLLAGDNVENLLRSPDLLAARIDEAYKAITTRPVARVQLPVPQMVASSAGTPVSAVSGIGSPMSSQGVAMQPLYGHLAGTNPAMMQGYQQLQTNPNFGMAFSAQAHPNPPNPQNPGN